MRRFAPALGGKVSRRDIVLSPHLWAATGAMFAIYAVTVLVIALAFGTFDDARLLPLSGGLALVATIILAARAPEPGSVATHAVLAASYLGSAAAVAAFAPDGSAAVISGLFTGPLLTIWLKDRRAIAAHLALASAALLMAALLSGNDAGTLFAACSFLAGTVVLTACSIVVLDAVEAQGEEYERLAMRDALTGIGNATFLEDALTVELTRHRSSNLPLAVIDLQLSDFAAINTAVGRSAGDALLTVVAAVLADGAPSTASVARTAGDRFAVILPATSRPGAEAFVTGIRRRLTLVPAGNRRLATRAGIATFPADGTHARTLRGIAADRLGKDTPQCGDPVPKGATAGALSVQIGDVPPIPHVVIAGTPSPEAQEGWSATRVDRRGIARDLLVWRATGAMILSYGLLMAIHLLLQPKIAGPATTAVTAAAFLSALPILILRPPAIGTPQNHAVVAVSWVMPAAAMAAHAPHASWAIGTTVFSGALISARLTDRRHIVAHLVGASGLFWALILSGRIDFPSVLACLTLLLSTWVLSGCFVIVFEAAEAQGRRMATLVLRDPVTGAGNERLLRERLIDEIPRHRDMQMPLVVIDLELSGFDALRTHEGRGAAEDALRDVAVLLGSMVEEPATISRIHNDRFRLLLPLTHPEDLAATLRELRIAICGTAHSGRSVLPRIGMASFPEDGVTDEALVAIAGMRMAADDPRAHDLTGASDPLDDPLPIRRIVAQRPGPASDHAERRRSAG
jgi:diguanylate cyclase (GGDEF)-like protein